MSSRRAQPLPGSSRDERPNIGILLRGLYQEIVEEVTVRLGQAGFDDIRPAHTSVFQHIDADGTRLTDLAQRAQLTKQSMGYLVDYLEEHGYVERRPDPSDRRANLICLTKHGWDQVRAALRIIAAIEKKWEAQLGSRKMQQLRKLLAELQS